MRMPSVYLLLSLDIWPVFHLQTTPTTLKTDVDLLKIHQFQFIYEIILNIILLDIYPSIYIYPDKIFIIKPAKGGLAKTSDDVCAKSCCENSEIVHGIVFYRLC